MGFLIVAVILLLIGILGFFGGRVAKAQNPTGSGGVVGGGLLAFCLLAVVAIIGLTSCSQVENGHIGIVKTFGSITDTTGEGLVQKFPWQTLDEVSVQEEKSTYNMTNGEGGAGSAVSSDSQEIGLVVEVLWQLQRKDAITLYRATGGHYEERILDPAVFQNTKEVTAGYKAIDFAKNRQRIIQLVAEAIDQDTEPYGLIVKRVTLKNFTLSAELNAAIEQTIAAEQNARREQAQIIVEEAKAKQEIAKAEGEKQSTIKRAEGDARANILRERNLTDKLIQWEAIQKLNPKVSIIVCPPRTVCVPNAGPIDLGK